MAGASQSCSVTVDTSWLYGMMANMSQSCGRCVAWRLSRDGGRVPVMSHGSGHIVVVVGVIMVVMMLECYCHGCGYGCGEVGGVGGGDGDSEVAWATVGCMATWHVW